MFEKIRNFFGEISKERISKDKEIEKLISIGKIEEAINFTIENRSFKDFYDIIDKIINRDKKIIEFINDNYGFKKLQEIQASRNVRNSIFRSLDELINYIKENQKLIIGNIDNKNIYDEKLKFVISVIENLWYNFDSFKIYKFLAKKIIPEKELSRLYEDRDYEWIKVFLTLFNYLNGYELQSSNKTLGYGNEDKDKISIYILEKLSSEIENRLDDNINIAISRAYELDEQKLFNERQYKIKPLAPVNALKYFIEEFKKSGILKI
ncbi:hypothetical protein HRbin34_00280 [bacterium HR34]|nr:hypothetical protein HRbin34_00280 [bacterium HR34]